MPESKSDLLHHYLPILSWLPRYDRTWLRTNLIAGLTVLVLLIPEGMASAQIAGVPPQAAFYAAATRHAELWIGTGVAIEYKLEPVDDAYFSGMGVRCQQHHSDPELPSKGNSGTKRAGGLTL